MLWKYDLAIWRLVTWGIILVSTLLTHLTQSNQRGGVSINASVYICPNFDKAGGCLCVSEELFISIKYETPTTLQWFHHGCDSVPNHQPHDCLLNRYSDADQRKHQSSASRHWPLCREFTGDRWIPRTNGQLRGKCFHLMTSSWKHQCVWNCVSYDNAYCRVTYT